MKCRMKRLDEKNKDVLFYIVFGVLTTGVNIATYWILAYIFSLRTMPSTSLAWIAAVLFAYLTNRKWVFHSQVQNVYALLREIVSFFMCRLATGGVDWTCMFLFVELLHLNDVLIKSAANIIVIILNYIASKYLIFKSR